MDKLKNLIQKIDRDDYLVAILVAVFIGSRLLLLALGFEIDMRFLEVAWQNVDTWLLKNDLARSIWYLHSQPPLYNLFMGVALKLFPVHFAGIFQIIYHFLGLTLGLCLYFIIKNLTINRLLAFVVALIFVMSPSLILFEGLFFYDFPVLVILAIIIFFFQKFVQTNKNSYLWGFFLSAAIMVLTRRIFHLLWFLVFAGVLLYFYRREWKRVALAALIPLLFIVFWYGKNLYYFGNFDASSWTGMGFFKTATYALTQEERQELFDEGVVSDHIFYGSDPFAIPVPTSTASSTFDKKLLAMPVVGDYTKKNGAVNYNYYAYIDLSRELKSEFISIIKNRPTVYLKGMVVTSIIFFSPASGYFAASENNNDIDENYQIVKKWDNFFDAVIYGQPLAWGGEMLKNYLASSFGIRPTQAWRLLSPGIFLIAWHLLSIIYGLKIIFQKNALAVYGPAVYLTVLFLLLNILYVSAVGIMAEAGENQRHRFMIEALNWILLALFVNNVILKKGPKS